MTQADRDRLVTLKKAKKRLITQRAAAEELEVSIRQVKRLLSEPPRVCRRQIRLSYATLAGISSLA